MFRSMINAMPLPVFNTPEPAAPAPAPPAAPAPAAAAPAAPATPAPAAPAAAAPAQVPTALNPAPATPAAPVPADWPTDWRDKMAAASSADGKTVDPKLVDRLKRYDSPLAFAKAGIEAQNRILAGKVGEDVPMPDEKTDPDGAKKWRDDRGIPADPTGYTIPDAIKTKLSPEDAPVLAHYTAYAHKLGMTPAEVSRNVEWYTDLVEQQQADQLAADTAAKTSTEDTLRKVWGENFREEQSFAGKFAAEAIPGINWFEARLPDGRALGNIPEVVQGLAKMGRLEFGDIAFAGGAAAKVTETRMAELKNIMDTDFDKWNASPALRAEYFKLVEAQEKRPPRA